MAQTGSVVTGILAGLLTDTEKGLSSVVATLAEESGVALVAIPPENVIRQNISVTLAERSAAVKYPVVQVYVDRVRNQLTEKFRTFSGKVRTVAEVRVSQDRIEGLEEQLRLYADAITHVLDANRGTWGQGVFFTGAYEVTYEPVQHGGKNLLQIAKVVVEVDLSV
jgi:hypothetical protein